MALMQASRIFLNRMFCAFVDCTDPTSKRAKPACIIKTKMPATKCQDSFIPAVLPATIASSSAIVMFVSDMFAMFCFERIIFEIKYVCFA